MWATFLKFNCDDYGGANVNEVSNIKPDANISCAACAADADASGDGTADVMLDEPDSATTDDGRQLRDDANDTSDSENIITLETCKVQ